MISLVTSTGISVPVTGDSSNAIAQFLQEVDLSQCEATEDVIAMQDVLEVRPGGGLSQKGAQGSPVGSYL